ncbi:MAG: PAS domain S-box protein [Dehalococcoidia bacterium]|nr:PAS domain S-box protein [Dehalococcoidia bacterium]
MIPAERRLLSLSKLSQLLAKSTTPEDVIPTAIEMVADVMNIEVVLIYSLNSDEKELVLSAYQGVPQEFARTVERMKLGEGFCGRVAETGEALKVRDATDDPYLSQDIVRQEKLQSHLIVPMKSRGRVVGTICAATRHKREFYNDEIDLMTAIANQIGRALEEARLHQEQILMTELLQQSEENYRELFQNASDAILIHDMDGKIIEANATCEKLLGYSVNDLLGKKVTAFLGNEALDLAREVHGRLLDGKTIERRYEQHLERKDGSEAIIELSTRLIAREGKPVGFHNIAHDVTEERKMRDNLLFYLRQVLSAQEEERKRLSRELHDDTSQSLLLLIHRLDAIASDPANKLSKSLHKEITQLHSLAVQILDGLRHYTQELRPAILDDMGLFAALEWIAANVEQERGISTTTKVFGTEHELSPETKLVLFRIAQEALTNVKRHSEASKAEIKLKFDAGKVTLTIADDGKGFELPRRLGDLARIGRLGLTGMEERARLLGGDLHVQSNLGKGTTITAELPYNDT